MDDETVPTQGVLPPNCSQVVTFEDWMMGHPLRSIFQGEGIYSGILLLVVVAVSVSVVVLLVSVVVLLVKFSY